MSSFHLLNKTKSLVGRKESTNVDDSLLNLEAPTIRISNFETESLGVLASVEEASKVVEENSPQTYVITSSSLQDASNKSGDNSGLIKPEKRRNLSLTRNEPPPLIHYLQDKEAPEVTDDKSPPQLLPEVIVTRTKLQKEKATFLSDEISYKASVSKNIKKIKRKSWMKLTFGTSLSDDQASNESHENFVHDNSHCSSTASGILKKGSVNCSEKQKKFKFTCTSEKPLGMGSSPSDASVSVSKFSPCNRNGTIAAQLPQEIKSDENIKFAGPEINEVKRRLFGKESSVNSRNDVDFESWMTETEDEEDDDEVFVTPLRLSTGKEERDTIDGIEFLGFETEHDMVEYTKIEVDYQGGNLNEEKGIHSDDGLDMMDDSFTYSESEAQTSSQAIIPTKTKDITKIKGWRTKNFAINNNPSNGLCSSGSLGSYEDDDGFVSCDVRIEEDVSLDTEEQGDLWSGVGDPFVQNSRFSLSNYSVEDSDKNGSKENSGHKDVKENKIMEVETFSNAEDQNFERPMNCQNKEKIYDENNIHDLRRYPKRLSARPDKNENIIDKKTMQGSAPVDSIKIPKKRGRKPKSLLEKQLQHQLANQFQPKRKRGRPKGSGRKHLVVTQTVTRSDVVYNLRNSTKIRNEVSDKTDNLKYLDGNEHHKSTNICEKKAVEEEKVLPQESTSDNSRLKNNTIFLSILKTSEENEIVKPAFSDTHSGLGSSNSTYIRTRVTDTLTTTVAHTSLTGPKISSGEIYPSKTLSFTSSVPSKQPSLATSLIINTNSPSITVPCCTSPITTAAGTTVCSFSTSPSMIATSDQKVFEDNYGRTASSCNNVKILQEQPCGKSLEYGLIVTTGVRRPLVSLALEQLRMLRKHNNYIDEHWARFSASVVITANSMENALQPSTVALPVRAKGLPFMSISSKTKSVVPQHQLQPKIRSQVMQPKFGPMTGTSVRFRCPRPFSQVGVRTIPVFKRQNDNQVPQICEARIDAETKICRRVKYQSGSGAGHFLEVDEEVRKVVEDLVSYVERCELKDLVIHEEPVSNSFPHKPPVISEITATKRKKGPMIRELNRLDVNVIEMWDARNKKCTEEYCKLGCICVSLECGRPALEEHCGKEECMFNCECESKSCKRGDSRQHTLLSPSTLLTIPPQNRRVLAKEEKEFQQTVIRAKHETFVLGSNGSCRRKREIKLPGRYRDSYVALGKDYGLVDFNITSNENSDPARRLTKISVVNNRELIQDIVPKCNLTSKRVSWEEKLPELKMKYNIKECFIKLVRNDISLPLQDEKEEEEETSILSHGDHIDSEMPNFSEKSRNKAVKSTTLLPNVWYDSRYLAARTAPINTKLLKRYKHQVSNENYKNLLNTNCALPLSSTSSQPAVGVSPEIVCQEKNINIPFPSDLVLDESPGNFGKIECVTTLSEEQFQKGDLSFGSIENFQTVSASTVSGEETKMYINSDKSVKTKTGSNISIDKIANLLNRKIRELKEKGGHVSFPEGNEESIHLLQWTALKNLFQAQNVQLWYYNGGSKLVITSTKLKPDPSYVNLNDITEEQHKQLPPIISDLLVSNGRKNKIMNRDVYALLHFDGRHVELVGTIYKNRSPPDQGCISPSKSIKLLAESKADLAKERLCKNINENKSVLKKSSYTSETLSEPKINEINSLLKNDRVTHTQNEKLTKSSDCLKKINGQHCDKEITVLNPSEVTSQESVFVQTTRAKSETELCSPNSFQGVVHVEKEKSSEPGTAKPNVNFDKKEGHPIENKNLSDASPVAKCNSVTRVRKLKTVLQSTKVQTAAGENVPVPLPLCATDSRWFVLSLNQRFDVLQLTSKKCSAKEKHIFESIKMASSHGKTVRLPLDKDMDCNVPNQPKFGIYAVPSISSFVFVGPYGLSEDPCISKYVFHGGKYMNVNELSGQSAERFAEEDKVEERFKNVVSILKRLCKPCTNPQSSEIGSWLYTKRLSESESKNVKVQKHSNETQDQKISKNESENCISSESGKSIFYKSDEKEMFRAVNMTSRFPKILKKSAITNNGSKSQTSGKLESHSDHHILVEKSETKKRKLDETRSDVKKFITGNTNLSTSGKSSSIQLMTSSSTSKNKTTASSLSASSLKKFVPNKSVSSQSDKSMLMGISQNIHQPKSTNAGWLVPSFPWIGSLRCNYDQRGLFFSHPVSGVKMMFSNLESTQLWLDRLFQSAILYIPRHLFINWTLKSDLENDDIFPFESRILNGNYLMTTKGVFDFDKLVASEAENYGLWPLEVLKLQDKKCRRDIELGFYRLQKSFEGNANSADNESSGSGEVKCSSKLDVLSKAVKEIEILKKKAWELEREGKKCKNTKHKSLLKLYNMMKGLPIDTKRNIVQRLKIQYDQNENSRTLLQTEKKDQHDVLNFSMARYCGNPGMFSHNEGSSDIEDYMSEYDEEEMEESPEELQINNLGTSIEFPEKNSELNESTEDNTVLLEPNKLAFKTTIDNTEKKNEDDDESVSISVVSASQGEEESTRTNNSDEITVTCLRDSSGVKSSVCTPFLNENANRLAFGPPFVKSGKLEKSCNNILKKGTISVKPCSSDMTSRTTQDNQNPALLACAVKRKIFESNLSTVSEERLKKMKVHIPKGLSDSVDSSHTNSGMDNLVIKKCKTIKINSNVDSESLSKHTNSVTSSEYIPVSRSSQNKASPSTVYVNVVSPSKNKIVPLLVENQGKDCGPDHNAIKQSSNTSLSNNPLKMIHHEMKQLFMKGTKKPLPFILPKSMKPSFPVVQASHGVLTSPATQPTSLPVLSVKKVSKESIPPGVEPRPATILPPPLIPIVDKKQTKPLSEKTTQLLTAIAPLPTLIKMVDGVPIDKGS